MKKPGSGIVQILDQKQIVKDGKKIFIYLVSDGERKCWQVSPGNKNVRSEMEIIPDYSIIKLVNITVRKGMRILINDFELLNDDKRENFETSNVPEISRAFLKSILQEKNQNGDEHNNSDEDMPLSPLKSKGSW